MTWLERQRFRRLATSLIWVVPVGALLMGWAPFRLVWFADTATRRQVPGFTADGARASVATFAGAMLTFIVFAFSVILIAIQLASTSLSPRVIALVSRSVSARIALGLFMCTFAFSTALTWVRRAVEGDTRLTNSLTTIQLADSDLW